MNKIQNLELIKPNETVIISCPTCNDSVIVALKDKTLNFYRLNGMDKLSANVKALYSRDLPTNIRNVEFEDKLYVVAKGDINNSSLVCIQTDNNDLKIKRVRRKQLDEQRNLLNI